MANYRPRMRATLSVPYLSTNAQRAKQERSDELITIELPLIEAHIERNNFQHADSAHVVVDWRDTTLDTRSLDDGVISIYMWDEDDVGQRRLTPDDVVFIGHIRNPERELEFGEHGTLRLECLDYTSLFINAKPFGSTGIPDYSQTLGEAWKRICSQVPGAGPLVDNLVFAEDAKALRDTKLGVAVTERFAKLAKVPTRPDTDAWAVWLQCVGMMGAVTWIEQDVCMVASATDFFTSVDQPVFNWGGNLTHLSESRTSAAIKGGVGLASFDAISGKVIEVFYPPIGDGRAQLKLTKAADRKKASGNVSLSDERDKRHMFTFWGVTDPAALARIAKTVWEQMSRQELVGKLRTPHMRVKTVRGRDFNVCKLRSGDAIRVRFDKGQRQYLTGLPNEAARMFYLAERGYSPDVARFLAKNAEQFAALGDLFYVDSVRLDLSLDSDGVATFDAEVSFMNSIEASKGAAGEDQQIAAENAKLKESGWL